MFEISRVDCKVIILYFFSYINFNMSTVELQWLEHLWDRENMFETGVIRAIECYL